MHQSQLPPAENKFHAGNGADGKHYWLTPPELYAALDEGNPAYGFKSLMVFMGESDKQMLDLLSSATTVRNDDQLPNAGSG